MRYNNVCITIALSRKLLSSIGYERSVFLQQLHYWLKNPKIRNLFADEDGITRNWVYNTYKSWMDELCYSSERTVRRMIRDLEKKGFIKSFEDKASIKYYTIDYEFLSSYITSLENGVIENEDCISEIEQHEAGTIGVQSGQGGCPKWPPYIYRYRDYTEITQRGRRAYARWVTSFGCSSFSKRG